MKKQIQCIISIDVYELPDFTRQELERQEKARREQAIAKIRKEESEIRRMIRYVDRLNSDAQKNKLEQEINRLEQKIAEDGLTREAEIAHYRQLLENKDIDSEDESTPTVH